jgi:TFIIF-interacting CTD phosphatase-like protein
LSCLTIFCSHKFHTIKNYLFFEITEKILLILIDKEFNFLNLKIVTKLSEILVKSGIRDQEKNLFHIPDPGVKKKKGNGWPSW